MLRRTGTRADVLGAIAAGRLRVDVLKGTAEIRKGRREWRAASVELVGKRGCSPYARVSFGSGFRTLLHRVVWWAAGHEIPDGFELNHKNGVKLDCSISNLELVTHAENNMHAITTGLHNPYTSKNGMFTPQQVRSIRARSLAESRHALARAFGTDASTISKIVRRVTYRSVL